MVTIIYDSIETHDVTHTAALASVGSPGPARELRYGGSALHLDFVANALIALTLGMVGDTAVNKKIDLGY